MQGNKSRDTKPEMLIRRYLHGVGLRYRVHSRPIKDWNRRADIVFPRAQIAIFINGCFWRGCPKHYITRKTNAAYWILKINRNMARDVETYARLTSEGWLVLQIWEHDDLDKKAKQVKGKIQRRRKAIARSCDEF
jgi:DNA mismatch endonuclease (patch repair protein)